MIMLQFSATLYTAAARLVPRSSWRLTALIASNSSTVATSEQSTTAVKDDDSAKFSEIQKNLLQKKEQSKSKQTEPQIKLDSLGKQFGNKNDTFIKELEATRSVNDMLDLAMLPELSKHNALKLISSITNQINSGKSQVANIEADQRFIYLKKIIEANDQIKIDVSELSDNLSQYAQLSTPAMITVISSLKEQGKRNTPLLRMLSYNIVKYNMKLNLKQCATLLHSMAVLNFSDKVLLEKISSNLLDCIPKNTNAIINKSIITSLGFLRYKNEDVLDMFCDVIFTKSMNYKFQDYSSILQSFAALQYKSEKARLFIETFAKQVNPSQTSLAEWLNIVWSLAILNALRSRHASTVLESAFTDKLIANSKLKISRKQKLLNINAYAQFMLKDYNGPLLSKDSKAFDDVPLVRTKAKQMYIDALLETLTKLFPSSSYFKTNINTNMGFLLDAEYHVSDQYKPISIENWNKQTKDVKRIGIMMHDYHDYCQGQKDLVGLVYLQTRLLKAKGYDLINISYENFSIQDKIEKRINYLKQCMKSVQEK